MQAALEQLLQTLAPRVLGVLVRRWRDFAAAEDATQESLIAAARQWPDEGVPGNPQAWLISVAMRRLTDQIRSDSARRQREAEYAVVETNHAADDTLILMFMCCHPALSRSSAIALTLRAVGGLTTAEIAHAFLVPESTMAQRISRAKQTIRTSGIRFSMPIDQAASLRAVLQVLYLIFNEGYAVSAGEAWQRQDLAGEATRLTRLLKTMATDPEIDGLLALMLLTDARREARSGPMGEMIPLDQQDRSRWLRAQIKEGVDLLSAALPQRRRGPVPTAGCYCGAA